MPVTLVEKCASVRMRPLRVALDADRVEAEPLGVGHAARWRRARRPPRCVSAAPPAAGSTVTIAPLPDVSTLVTLEASLKAKPCLRQDALELLGDFAVHAGQDAVEIFDHDHLGAEPAPDRAEFEPDHARADDDEALRHASSSSAPVEDTTTFSSIVDARQRRDVRAGRDDDVLGLDDPGSCRPRLSPRPGRRPRSGPCRRSASILFFLSRNSTPFTLPSTPSCLKAASS